MTQRHTRSLVRLIRNTVGCPLVGAEIGVWRGHTSFALLQSFPLLRLFAVDPWDLGGGHTTMPKTVAELQAGKQEFLGLTEFAADRRVILQMTSRDATYHVVDNSLDFVFIDGEHLYQNVKDDLILWHPKVRVGGLFCGHDYNGKGDNGGGFGVRRAVDEFAQANTYQVCVAPGLIWYWMKK